jgi:pimeloyl-ACP methyl ester carboxylesterase
MLTTTITTLASGARLRLARLGGESGDASRPTIVLLHGYPDNLQIFGQLAVLLARTLDVVAIDWPGMGESDAWKGGATPSAMADRLVSILDHLGIVRCFVLGIDMGGQPALVFASKYPRRTRGVIAMNSLVMGDEKTSWEIDLLRKFGFNRLVLRNLPTVVFRRAERSFFPKGVRLPDDVREDLWTSFRRDEVREFIVRMCAGYQATLSRLPVHYGRINVPTLVLWGENDRHFPVVHAERLHATIAGSELTIVEGGEHWMIWDRAEEVATRIESFVATHRPEG